MPVSVAFIKELENVDPKLRRVLLSMLEELERQREESGTKHEFNELKEIVRELGKTVRELSQHVNELAEAQKRTEARAEEIKERLEGLSNTVGYTLESRAYKALPVILKAHGIEVEGRLLRRYVKIGKKERQLNIYGYGLRAGERILIWGEAKVRPSRKEISRFERLCKALSEKEGLEVFKLFVAHDFLPTIEEELQQKGILPVWSYDLE